MGRNNPHFKIFVVFLKLKNLKVDFWSFLFLSNGSVIDPSMRCFARKNLRIWSSKLFCSRKIWSWNENLKPEKPKFSGEKVKNLSLWPLGEISFKTFFQGILSPYPVPTLGKIHQQRKNQHKFYKKVNFEIFPKILGQKWVSLEKPENSNFK